MGNESVWLKGAHSLTAKSLTGTAEVIREADFFT
jgi:hypothetical protein